MALEADGDFAVVADAHAGLLAPDVGPPRTGRRRTQDGAFFGQSLRACGVRGGAQFAVDFMLVGVGQKLVEQVVGSGQFEDAVGGQQGREAFLPVVVAAFDFALGLGRGRVAQGHAVEVERGAQLGEGVRGVGEEEGVVVHVEGQGQAMGLEGAGEKVQVGQEGFAFVEAGTRVDAGGVVEQIEQALLVGRAGEEGVGRGVVLPEGTVVTGLPASDGLGRGLVAGVGGQPVFEGPAADAGAVGLEVQAAVQFAGGGAVRGGRLGGQELGEQRADLVRPGGMMVAAGAAGRPGIGVALGAGAQIVGVEFVEAGAGQAQFGGGSARGEVPGAMVGQEVTDEGSRQALDQLLFFMAAERSRGMDFAL